MKVDVVEAYFKHIENACCSKVCEERFGKKYVFKAQLGSGSISRVQIEEGLEMTTLETVDLLELDFDNRDFKENILEIGYCYCGEAEIFMLPSLKKYVIKAGDLFIYKMLNDVDHFKFKYQNCKTISVAMGCQVIKKALNPKCKESALLDWQEHLNQIFEQDILIIEAASYEIGKITKQMDAISMDEMLGYVHLKSKALEFIVRSIRERNHLCEGCSCSMSELDKIAVAQEIIQNDLERIPSVKALADQLGMSIYKLQKGFKEVTGDTVHVHIQKMRLEKAKELLRHTELSILQIANEVGYENPSKFAHLFKQYNDVTPLKYRKS
ncbi:helix-turn-helix domain-containing protein [Fusibacter ferrireducens]|uniref:Helix-turn-helix transcriptional regulator n=1 Tax=Fusibacter ferrireducens TaxID=2785058 RepID=A0ABR9ZZD8_9FIRM|nr:AraC family transcriptional regulator [Fusibacter ferrireducens]MBF4694969.1 helix-turn-helix transcriptional regulator [Fusibacter ferrireducens]